MPTVSPRILIVDDDPDAGRLLSFFLRRRFPAAHVQLSAEPRIDAPFNVYILDNDFEGRRLAPQLARSARAIAPDALIIAFSGTLDLSTLKHLVGQGCSGVCDKADPGDVHRTLEIIAQFLALRSPAKRARGLLGSVRAITSLLREWNARLDAQERADARELAS